jgi:hypothetical protein
MAHLTLRAVNAAIKKAGGKEILVRGNGYFYFAEGEAHKWYSDSIYTMYLNDLPLERWIAEWKMRRDDYRELLKKRGSMIDDETQRTIDSEAPQNDAGDSESREQGERESAAPAKDGAEVSDGARAGRKLAAMSDKELTAAAARAIGLAVDWAQGAYWIRETREPFKQARGFMPLLSDETAFRVMVALNIRWAWVTDNTLEAAAPARYYRRAQVENGDKCAALRRAITLAAADVEPKGEGK